VKEGEVGREYSTHGGEQEFHIGFRRESRKERNHYKDPDVGGRMILKWILQKYYGVV
jgi:hypothetical protein